MLRPFAVPMKALSCAKRVHRTLPSKFSFVLSGHGTGGRPIATSTVVRAAAGDAERERVAREKFNKPYDELDEHERRSVGSTIGAHTRKLDHIAEEKFHKHYDELDTHEKRSVAGTLGAQKRKEQLGHEGYKEMGHKGGEARKEQLGHEGYQELGHKGAEARKAHSGHEMKREGEDRAPADDMPANPS